MKALKVLTGLHAGAQIRLASGHYRLGAGADADVCISDWQVDDLMLNLGEDGITRACHEGAEEVLIPDFVAVPYGDVVFCVGPDDDSWPRDLDLLAGLWKTAELSKVDSEETANDEPDNKEAAADEVPAVSQGKAFKTAGIALACTAVVGALLTAALLLAGTQQSQAANVVVNVDNLSKQLKQAFVSAGLKDLDATPRQGKIIVSGMVKTADESVTARGIMDRWAKNKGVRQYDVAEQDANNIAQSLAGTGAEVNYSGNGVFRITGSVSSLKQFHQLLADVRSDLDSNVRQLDVQVNEARAVAPKLDYSEMVQVGSLRYIETPDGTKHLYSGGADEQD